MLFIFFVILVALAFEYINGFHDTANSIATVVSTKVVTPRQAIVMATVFNLLGALAGTAVAATIGKGLVDTNYVTLPVILCGLISAIIWNLVTWWLGLPSSSSHALIGGLCGATLAKAGSDWSVIHWTIINPTTGAHSAGLLYKVVLPMLVSPVFGLIFGFILMMFLLFLLKKWRPATVNRIFGKLQLVSASWMAFSHGSNDAQKTMGIITLTLFTATTAGSFEHLPAWASFLKVPVFNKDAGVPFWVELSCALTMAAGTAAGGWKIIRTLGHKMVKLQPIHGFAAETTAAAIIQVASHWGIPLSTTHVISSAIMGVGASKRLNAVNWTIVQRMVIAWVLTIPLTGAIGYILVRVFHMA